MEPRPTPLDALKPLAGRALEAALNRALALDPATRDSLAALDGRSIVLRLAQPAIALQLQVAGSRLRVGPVAGDEADLSVRATMAGLLGQLLRRDAGTGAMRIEGDADLARRLQRLAERFDPDWQKPFAAVFGDVLGVQVANAVAGALRGARGAAGALGGSTVDYLQHESRDVVPRAEQQAFFDDVDTLRDDVERLAARIERLQGRHA